MRRKRTLDPSLIIDYKNPEVLKRFITDRGKIIPRRISGATAAQQRMITVAIKRARFLSLIPCSTAHNVERGFAGEMQNVAQAFAAAAMRSRGPNPRTGGDRDRGERGDRDRGERGDRERGERGERSGHFEGRQNRSQEQREPRQ